MDFPTIFSFEISTFKKYVFCSSLQDNSHEDICDQTVLDHLCTKQLRAEVCLWQHKETQFYDQEHIRSQNGKPLLSSLPENWKK